MKAAYSGHLLLAKPDHLTTLQKEVLNLPILHL
jgi:hypothetical protein